MTYKVVVDIGIKSVVEGFGSAGAFFEDANNAIVNFNNNGAQVRSIVFFLGCESNSGMTRIGWKVSHHDLQVYHSSHIK